MSYLGIRVTRLKSKNFLSWLRLSFSGCYGHEWLEIGHKFEAELWWDKAGQRFNTVVFAFKALVSHTGRLLVLENGQFKAFEHALNVFGSFFGLLELLQASDYDLEFGRGEHFLQRANQVSCARHFLLILETADSHLCGHFPSIVSRLHHLTGLPVIHLGCSGGIFGSSRSRLVSSYFESLVSRC